jgi:hypothetical protein
MPVDSAKQGRRPTNSECPGANLLYGGSVSALAVCDSASVDPRSNRQVLGRPIASKRSIRGQVVTAAERTLRKKRYMQSIDVSLLLVLEAEMQHEGLVRLQSRYCGADDRERIEEVGESKWNICRTVPSVPKTARLCVRRDFRAICQLIRLAIPLTSLGR